MVMPRKLNVFWNKLTRKKVIDLSTDESQLSRVLSTLDLTFLGIGSTLGVGIYVLAGSVARSSAGPAVVISFLIAALASILAGLCYAEFGARVPKAGSAYVYSYVCVGEIVAFIVGWNLIMEYVIGCASVARGYSGYIDSLFGGEMVRAFKTLSMTVGPLHCYVDWFALGITLLLTIILAFGVKESTMINNIFTCLNLVVVIFVVIAGSFKADSSNWAINVSDIDPNVTDHHGKEIHLGKGGFAPFGFAGIMKGAATCFYGFVGFDVIATTGEEAKNPKTAIPLSIIFSLLFVFLAYFGVSTVITMMAPYYLQDIDAPLPHAFAYANFEVGKWVVNIGALFGLSTSLLGCMFPMPRVIYAMASDGLLFKFLARIHPRFKTPFRATIISGVFGAFMAGLFNLEVLIDMMSIGTLTAYTLVSICVLILRYKDNPEEEQKDSKDPLNFGVLNYLRQVFNLGNNGPYPTKISANYSLIAVSLFCIFGVAFCAVAIFGADLIVESNIPMLVLLGLFGAIEILLVISLSFQPVSGIKLSFKVPLVPLIPALSILTNIYLVLKLGAPTWIRFSIWMVIGFIIYAYCLLSGNADQAYENLNPANKRKYSKISLNVINTNTLPPGLGRSRPKSMPSSSNTSQLDKVTSEGEVNHRPRSEGVNQNGNIKLVEGLERNVASENTIVNNNFHIINGGFIPIKNEGFPGSSTYKEIPLNDEPRCLSFYENKSEELVAIPKAPLLIDPPPSYQDPPEIPVNKAEDIKETEKSQDIPKDVENLAEETVDSVLLTAGAIVTFAEMLTNGQKGSSSSTINSTSSSTSDNLANGYTNTLPSGLGRARPKSMPSSSNTSQLDKVTSEGEVNLRPRSEGFKNGDIKLVEGLERNVASENTIVNNNFHIINGGKKNNTSSATAQDEAKEQNKDRDTNDLNNGNDLKIEDDDGNEQKELQMNVPDEPKPDSKKGGGGNKRKKNNKRNSKNRN